MFWIHACCRTLYSARRTRSMYHVKDHYINIHVDCTLTKFYVLKIQNILKLYKSRNKSLINCMKKYCRTFWRHVTKRYIIVISKSNTLRHVIRVGHTSCRRRLDMGGQHINDQTYLKCLRYNLFSYKLLCEYRKN